MIKYIKEKYFIPSTQLMFTGLIQTLGTIDSQGQDSFKISVIEKNRELILSDLAIGDSVAVNGVCLTVEEIFDRGFVATTSPETLEKTTLGNLTSTVDYLNLETSLKVGSKIGGHFVTGHVDGIGCSISSVETRQSWEMTFGIPIGMSQQWEKQIAPYLVNKGSIAINGISLTVAECAKDSSWFKVAVIPHSYQETNLSLLQPGDLVNLESDILGKYVDRLINFRGSKDKPQDNISLAFLSENGYL